MLEGTVYTIVRETMKYTATKILNSIERIEKDELDCDVALRFSSDALANLILMATQGETQHQDFETFLEDEVDLAELYLDSGKYNEPDDEDDLIEGMF
jgi:hypothetical protein